MEIPSANRYWLCHLTGIGQEALTYFQRAAQGNPNYIFEAHCTGKEYGTISDALNSTRAGWKRLASPWNVALFIDKEDHLARIYLRLIRAWVGDSRRADRRGFRDSEETWRGGDRHFRAVAARGSWQRSDRSNGRSLEDSKAGVRAFRGSKLETPGLPEKKSDVTAKMRRAGRVTLR